MRIATRTVAVLAIVVAFAGRASAQPLQYFFADTAGNFTNTFNAVVGSTLDVDVYLNDTGGTSAFFTNTTQGNNLNTNHLLGIGLRILSSVPAVALVPNSAAVTPNVDSNLSNPGGTIPRFNNLVQLGAGPGTVVLQENVLAGLGYSVAGSARAYIGRLRFNSVSVGSTILSFADNDLAFAATSLGSVNSPATNGGAILDPVGGPAILNLFSNTATINVTAIPEPTSLALCGLAAAGLGIYRRRKAKAAAETVQP